MAKKMAKTMAKLQPRARKTSPKKTSSKKRAVASPVKSKARAQPKQRFNVNHFRAEDFRTDGLRSYAQYRDLGMSKATNGLMQAHVIRLIPPCDPAVVSKRHYHDVHVQMIYVLKGYPVGIRGAGRGDDARGHCLAAAAADRAHRAGLLRRLRAARNHLAGGVRDRGTAMIELIRSAC